MGIVVCVPCVGSLPRVAQEDLSLNQAGQLRSLGVGGGCELVRASVSGASPMRQALRSWQLCGLAAFVCSLTPEVSPVAVCLGR